MQVAGYRYSTQGFYNLSDSAYSRMSDYRFHGAKIKTQTVLSSTSFLKFLLVPY
ncbi:hypothetical protein BIA72_004162 [Escherichia coli]|nr:hypothetical protein [Escherichia coli]EFH1303977.1 hypothetical protein [Escherichia coli]